jgi:hypothetical protein
MIKPDSSVNEHKMKAKVIAYYLPQFHPIPENDEWWGKGFTEWTNVGKAKKYFIGHEQPKVPADLGYYDLRLPQVRQAQAELAREAGIDAFCYWHYWLGNGKQLLEMPIQEVIRLGEPDFPFCLGWANHSWVKKDWNSMGNKNCEIIFDRNKTLIKQDYPGEKDIEDHFYTMLPIFCDRRYFRIHNRLVFVIYKLEDIPDFCLFKKKWNDLAKKNKLPIFFFIANSESIYDLDKTIYKQCDAVALCRIQAPTRSQDSFFFKIFRFITRNFSRMIKYSINTVSYKNVIKIIDTPRYSEPRVYPTIIPNWDPSPRRGPSTTIYTKSTPELFKRHIKMTLKHLEGKGNEDKILFLKSWNEWAEGNYMEPDLKWGKAYINALREALEEVPLPPPPPPTEGENHIA